MAFMIRLNRYLYKICLIGFLVTAFVLLVYSICAIMLLNENFRSPMSNRLILGTNEPTTTTTTTAFSSFTTTTIKPLDEKSIMEKIESFNQNLPFTFLKEKSKNGPTSTTLMRMNATCAPLPDMTDIQFSNNHWQSQWTANGQFYLFGAYYDNRPRNRLGRTVRILAMLNRIETNFKTYCQFWFANSSVPEIASVVEYKYIWNKKWGNYVNDVFQPYLMACQLLNKSNTEVPVAVSLVARKCDKATNLLKVINNRPRDDDSGAGVGAKKDFAVCVKGLDFLDITNETALAFKLIEWLETLRLLGASHVYMYELQISPRLRRMLAYYQETEKFVTLSSLTLPGGQPNSPYLQHMFLSKKINSKRQNEIIPYNDCFYRNMYLYRYIALLDIDEIIMPKIANTWKELLDERVIPQLIAKNSNASLALPQSFNARNVYFLDDLLDKSHGLFNDIPAYAHMLQHVYRTKNYTKKLQYVKCFHDTEQVVALHNHLPLACFGRVCKSHEMNTSEAHLQHYRADCVRTLKKTCGDMRKDTVLDTSIWKLKNQLIERLATAVKLLQLY